MSITVRFAPSPTGRLHVGNLRTALMNQLFALKENGRFVLRVDDTDLERSKAEYEAAIEEDLAWLGFRVDVKHKQSDRFALYDAAAAALKDAGHLYPCYETAEELERKRKLQRAQGLPPVYDRAALNLSKADIAALEADGRKPHWRFKLSHERVSWSDLVRGDSAVETSALSDPILVRDDGSYLYTLPSCVDDLEMNVSHVVRGEDHVTNSGAQIEIFDALRATGLAGETPQFAHTPLLVGANGEKLSKRLGSLAVADFREQGLEPLALSSLLAKIGTSDPVEARRDWATLAAEFDFAKIGRAPARFDEAELKRLNAQLLHAMPFEEAGPRLQALGVTGGEAFWRAVRANVEVLSDTRAWWRVVDGPIEPVIEDAGFVAAAADLTPAGPYDGASWGVFIERVKTETGAKGKKLFMPLRLALTGQRHGPEMDQLFALIGPDKAKRRLQGETV